MMKLPRRPSAQDAAVRPAVPQGRQAHHRPDSQHPALSRRSPWAQPAQRSRPAMDTPAPAHHRGFPGRDSRHAPPDRVRPLLRGPAPANRSAAPPTSVTTVPPSSSATSSGCFERSSGPYLAGRKLTYADLSLFQVVQGLRYAFPKMMRRLERRIPLIVALHDRVAARRAHRRLSGVGSPHSVQPDGHFPPLPGIGR